MPSIKPLCHMASKPLQPLTGLRTHHHPTPPQPVAFDLVVLPSPLSRNPCTTLINSINRSPSSRSLLSHTPALSLSDTDKAGSGSCVFTKPFPHLPFSPLREFVGQTQPTPTLSTLFRARPPRQVPPTGAPPAPPTTHTGILSPSSPSPPPGIPSPPTPPNGSSPGSHSTRTPHGSPDG